ncbi:MAG: DUF2061 domain-containing protein [Nitratireductor sp.]
MTDTMKKPPEVQMKRSIAKAFSWRTIGTIDTFILSFLLITYIGPFFGMDNDGNHGDTAKAAGLIAITEVITKMVLYFAHERGWAKLGWGVSVIDGKRAETYARTTTKTTTWRVIASLDTVLLAWFFTGNIGTAISIGGLEVITKLVLYFFHERAWSNISYGIKLDEEA